MAARRSELAALRVEDLDLTEDGYRVTIRKSKTDQAQLGVVIPMPRGYRLKPVAATLAWLQTAQITEGYVFRRVHRSGAVRASGLAGAAIADVVKQRAEQAGFDPTVIRRPHLRSGFLTSAAEAGASMFKMMAVSRHKAWTRSPAMCGVRNCSRTQPGRRSSEHPQDNPQLRGHKCCHSNSRRC